ncbi:MULTISPECIES: RraA family protein [Actinomadura]|uniref:Putative 4-hydroxy-4-methyl-2-oxoglutarate aldolase n=1 Tax=Actinomadura yumaensis TaxID=111807 RepID=A0ABW2CC18_9ACTN|nr:RraA family protein [Actinomadura sp. J1-007]
MATDAPAFDGRSASEPELFALLRERLHTPVVGDILDTLGLMHQFLPPEIHGIRAGVKVVGRAMPVVIADVSGPQSRPFGRLTEALDQLEPGEVYVAQNGTVPTAAWGEILTVTARGHGAAGAVIDGYHRDTRALLAQDWPVFSRGGFAQDAGVRKVVVDYRVPIEIGGVRTAPGDLVFGDEDGVVVVPTHVEQEVIERAIEKVSTEGFVRQAIEQGMSSTDAFARFGVL